MSSDRVTAFLQKYGRPPTEFDPDYLEMLRMTKYRILTVPDVETAKCGNCGCSKKDGRKYVDFGLHVDWHGVVFLCSTCIDDIARNLGLYQVWEERLKVANDALLNLRQKRNAIDVRDDFLKIFEEVKAYASELSLVSDDSNSNPESPVVSNEKPNEPGTKVDEPKTTGAKRETTKSATGSGPKEFSSLAELLESHPG